MCEFSRQEYWSGLPFPSPGDLPDPGIDPRSPALQADSLPAEPPGTLRFSLVARFIHGSVCQAQPSNAPHHPLPPLVSMCLLSAPVSPFLLCKYVVLPNGTEYNPRLATWAPRLGLHPLLPLPSFPTRCHLPPSLGLNHAVPSASNL